MNEFDRNTKLEEGICNLARRTLVADRMMEHVRGELRAAAGSSSSAANMAAGLDADIDA